MRYIGAVWIRGTDLGQSFTPPASAVDGDSVTKNVLSQPYFQIYVYSATYQDAINRWLQINIYAAGNLILSVKASDLTLDTQIFTVSPIAIGTPITVQYFLSEQIECDNIPDGQATVTLVVEDTFGERIYLERSFDYKSDTVSVVFDNFSLGFNYKILGYRFKAQKGFVNGSIQLQEKWVGVGEFGYYYTDPLSISFSNTDSEKLLQFVHYVHDYKPF